MYTRPDLQSFYRSVQTYGLGKAYNFQVEDIIGIPAFNSMNQDYKLYVQSATVPSIKTNITAVPYKAFEFIVPTNVTFPENQSWSLEFFSDDSLLIRALFENWTKTIYNPLTLNSDRQALNIATNKLVLNILSDMPVKNVTDSVSLTPDTQYILHGIFPVQVGPLSYNISDNGQVVKFRATMAYQYFESKNVKIKA